MAAKRSMQEAWPLAQRLEQEGRLDEADRVLGEAIECLQAVSQIAHLYQLRMVRLLAAGDRAGAIDAYHRSCGWMRNMASGATSGGEGAALSYEADQHEEELKRLLGFDPGPPGKNRA